VREKVKELRFRIGGWLQSHKRGIFLTFWFTLFLVFGGSYFFLAQYFSLPAINPIVSSQKSAAAVTLSDSTNKETPSPLTGVFYSASQASVWGSRRPIAVMIDNHQLARPHQFGVQKADLVYEAVAEGGITRFLAVFHSQDVTKLGPVRSSRVYYIDWALQFPAYYAHVGGASTPGPANIHTYIAAHGVLDLDQFRLGSPTYTFGGNVMMGNIVLSHLDYTSTANLWAAGKALYPGTNKLPKFARWNFKADAPFANRPKSQKISFSFGYLSAYAGHWIYDRNNNVYLREQGGKAHIDQATGKQLFAKNVVLAHMNERLVGDGTSHRLYTTVGKGDAEVYLDGKKVLATWKRSSLSSRMLFFKRGTNEEIAFNRGLTWIEIIPK